MGKRFAGDRCAFKCEIIIELFYSRAWAEIEVGKWNTSRPTNLLECESANFELKGENCDGSRLGHIFQLLMVTIDM